jgi:hypothetical protein
MLYVLGMISEHELCQSPTFEKSPDLVKGAHPDSESEKQEDTAKAILNERK